MGIRHGAPLLLPIPSVPSGHLPLTRGVGLSPPDPLRWAPAGTPFCPRRQSRQSAAKGGRDFECSTPFGLRPLSRSLLAFGHFPPPGGIGPLTGGIGLSPLKSPLLKTINFVLADFISFASPWRASLTHCVARPLPTGPTSLGSGGGPIASAPLLDVPPGGSGNLKGPAPETGGKLTETAGAYYAPLRKGRRKRTSVGRGLAPAAVRQEHPREGGKSGAMVLVRVKGNSTDT